MKKLLLLNIFLAFAWVAWAQNDILLSLNEQRLQKQKVSMLVLGGWASTGVYELDPGEAAVVLRLGAKNRTELDPGLKWRFPPPIETLEIVNVSEIRRESFGLRRRDPRSPDDRTPSDADTPAEGDQTTTFENAMQTADSNIVNIGYVLQYQIGDAFAYLYSMEEPEETLFDATRTAVRETVGKPCERNAGDDHDERGDREGGQRVAFGDI